jgi:hypothetical protein
MKNIIFFAIIVLLICTCGSIPTIPRPGNVSNTIVIGKMDIFAWNFASNIDIDTLKMTIRSIDYNEMHHSTMLSNGFFYFSLLNYGIHEILQITYEIDGNLYTHVPNQNLDKYFIVHEGKINNLGFYLLEIKNESVTFRNIGRHFDSRLGFLTFDRRNTWDKVKWNNNIIPSINPRSTHRDSIDNKIFMEFYDFNIDLNDPNKYLELWIYWNILSNEPILPYPIPVEGVMPLEWINNNLHKLPNTRLEDLIMTMTIVDVDGNVRMEEEINLGLAL